MFWLKEIRAKKVHNTALPLFTLVFPKVITTMSCIALSTAYCLVLATVLNYIFKQTSWGINMYIHFLKTKVPQCFMPKCTREVAVCTRICPDILYVIYEVTKRDFHHMAQWHSPDVQHQQNECACVELLCFECGCCCKEAIEWTMTQAAERVSSGSVVCFPTTAVKKKLHWARHWVQN